MNPENVSGNGGGRKPGSALARSSNDLFLWAVIVLSFALFGIGVASYIAPPEHMEISELQPAVRVANLSEFPVGASRLVTWGFRIILVVRSGEDSFAALDGASPKDGCIMEWNADSRRVESPCNHLVYDLAGNVVTGLTTTPLQRYAVFVRGGTVFVTETS